MKKWLFLPFLTVSATVYAEWPLTSDNSIPNLPVKKALSPSKEDEQKARILSMRADLLARRPELLSSITNMERVLLSPQAMENYLRTMLDAETANAAEKIDQQRAKYNADAQDDTAKVDAEMARLERAKGGNLGTGSDATNDPGTYPLENIATNSLPVAEKNDSGENVVAQADAAFEGLKQMIEEKRRLLASTNDTNSGSSTIVRSHYALHKTDNASPLHNDTNVSLKGFAGDKLIPHMDSSSDIARKASILWHLDSLDPAPSSGSEDPERTGRLYKGILGP